MAKFDYENVAARQFLASLPGRHKAMKVLCSFPNGDLKPCCVKLCRDRATAAACISEHLATSLLRHSHISTLTPVRVTVSDDLYSTVAHDAKFRNGGTHYGTVWKDNVDVGPLQLEDPLLDWRPALYLWVYDTWLKNYDRLNEGNLLVERFAGDKLKLIASDHSDCFGGCETWPVGLGGFDSVKGVAEPGAIHSDGRKAQIADIISKVASSARKDLQVAMDKCRSMATKSEDILRVLPSCWLELSGIDPGYLVYALTDRALDLEAIIKPDLHCPPDAALKGALAIEGKEGTSNG